MILKALQSAGIPATLEPVGLSRADNKRPDGLTLVPWQRGKCLVWDATVVHRLADSYHVNALLDGSKVASAAELRKLSKYRALSDYYMQPVAIETLGGIGELSLLFIRRLGLLISRRSDDVREAQYLRQRLSINLVIGNAACIFESLGSHSVSDDI